MSAIKRIRWTETNSRSVRLYQFSTPIMSDPSRYPTGTFAGISRPVTEGFGLTDTGRKLVNRLISMKGVTFVWASSYVIHVKIALPFNWSDNDLHDTIMAVLNTTLFDGELEYGKVDESEPLKNLEGLQRIIWAGTKRDNTRWYGFTAPVKINEKDETSAVVSSVLAKNWCELTDVGLALINSIIALTPIETVWVSSYGISVRIPEAFEWSDNDLHENILKLLNLALFNGAAEIINPGMAKAAA